MASALLKQDIFFETKIPEHLQIYYWILGCLNLKFNFSIIPLMTSLKQNIIEKIKIGFHVMTKDHKNHSWKESLSPKNIRSNVRNVIILLLMVKLWNEVIRPSGMR